MHFQTLSTLLPSLFALMASVSAVNPVYHDLLKVWDIGGIPKRPDGQPLQDMGACGSKIKEGKWGCGRFPHANSAPRVTYICNHGRLRRVEHCKEFSKNNMCVRNSRRKGKAFYPFEPADDLVCVKKKDAQKP